MALPTISNNSPSAGYISWTAFSIAYDGKPFSVAAGNASEAFVIWKYNAGAPTILKTNAFPANLTADDIILFLNKEGVGALVPMTDVLDGSLVVPGSIIANTIAANAIQSWHVNANTIKAIHIESNSITAEQIQANTITGNELAYNSITADKIGVGSVGDSLITNGSFEEAINGLATGWWGDAGGTNGSLVAVTGVSTSGTNTVQLTLPAVTDKIYLKQKPEKYIPVTPTSGRSWYISAKIGASTALTKGLYVRAVWYDANKTYKGYTPLVNAADDVTLNNVPVANAFQVYEGQVAPSSVARYMSIEISVQSPDVAGVYVYVDEVIAREVVVSAVIGDGQISTPKVAANAIIANHIGSNIIQGNHVAANQIAVRHLTVTDLTNFAPSLAESPDDWELSGGMTIASSSLDPSGMRLSAAITSGTAWAYGPYMAVKPGEVLYATATTYRDATGAGAMYLRYGWYDKNKALISGTNYTGTTQASNSPNGTKFELAATVPAGTAYARIVLPIAGTAGNNGFYSITGRRQLGGELIVDGAIVTEHMKANTINANVLLIDTITGNHIKSNSIFGTHINSNTINALHVQSNSIGATHINTNSITAKHIGTNTMNANIIMANTITTKELGANVVTSNEIAGNAITGKHIAAGSIVASKLMIGSATNALPDPNFLNPPTTALRLGRSSGGVAGWTVDPGTATSVPVMTRTTTTTGDNFRFETTAAAGNAENAIKVSAGEKWRMEVDVETDISAGVRWNYYFYRADGTVSSYTALSSYSTAVGKRTLGYTYTVPAGVVAIDVSLTCNTTGVVWKVYGGAIVALQSNSTLIEDGAITTTLLNTNAVTSNKIGANQITGTHINANSIGTIQLAANSVTAAAIAAGSVNATHIVVSDTTNLHPDPRFDIGVLNMNGWVFDQALNSGNGAISITPGAGTTYAPQTPKIPVMGLTHMYFAADIAVTGGTAPQFNLRVYCYDKAGANNNQGVPLDINVDKAVNYAGANGTYQTISGRLRIPAGTLSISFRPTFYAQAGTGEKLYLTNARILRATGGELIVDGAIDGQTITGGVVQTSKDANVINARMGPIQAYNPFGGVTTPGIGFVKNGATGSGPSMYSDNGYNLTLTQGGAVAESGMAAYLSLGNDAASINADQQILIQAGGGASISSGMGDLNLNGNAVRINGAKQGLRHVTTNLSTTAPPTNTPWGPGIYTVNLAKSTDATFVSFPANDQIKFLETGVYSISLAISNKTTTPSSARVLLQNSAKTTTIIGAVKPDGGAFEWSLVLPNYYATANEILAIVFVHNGTGTQSWDSTLRVTQIH